MKTAVKHAVLKVAKRFGKCYVGKWLSQTVT